MDVITLAHGSGGEETGALIEKLFYKYLSNEFLLQKNDATNIGALNGEIAITTDSFVISPIFFKGGNIGKLSVCGTVNDLVVSGATPLYLSLSFVIEEGFLMSDLEKIVRSISETAKKAKVKIVCGDTKVVDKGKCDKLFINTTGIGIIEPKYKFAGIHNVKAGDKIIVTGTIGDHGVSIMNEREFLVYDSPLQSDCAPLTFLIEDLKEYASDIKIMRDPTRGGLGTTLNELIDESSHSMLINEDQIPYKDEVIDFCNLLGMDPLYMANEGKAIIIVSEKSVNEVLKIIKNNIIGKDATVIGEVIEREDKHLYLKTKLGAEIIVPKMKGEILPRIC